MSRGNGKKESRDRIDGASGTDRIHSVDGGRVGSWSLTEVEDDSDGSGSTVGGNVGPVEGKAWFEPVKAEEISDCPGGICPVPWAKHNEEEKKKKKERKRIQSKTEKSEACIGAKKCYLSTLYRLHPRVFISAFSLLIDFFCGM